MAHQRHKLVFGEMVLGEHGVEEFAIEVAVGRSEFRVIVGGVADHIVRNLESKTGRLLFEETAVDHLAEDIVNDPELLGLLNVDRSADARAQPFDLAPHSRLQILCADALVADSGDHRVGGGAVTEDIPDAPDPEDQDQEDEQTLDDEGSSLGANRLEHGGKWALVWRPGRLTRLRAGVILASQIETGPRGRNMGVRTKLVAGNWKMNGLREGGAALARGIAQRAVAAGGGGAGCELLVCPPATLLAAVGGVIAGSGIALGGQDCHAEPKGAYTGDISAEMLADAGCSHVILGHSERRHGHVEADAVVREKILGAWRAGLVAILCVGETQSQRQAGRAADIVSSQLAGSLPNGATPDNLVVAYEPVWAIGTGLTATLEDIAAMHATVRACIPADARILYGGSVNPQNAAGILGLAGVDGALVGGASLDAENFWAIARSCG
jgi:triosephosphate isomerase